MNVMVSLSNTPMAHPPRSNPFLRSSSDAPPFPYSAEQIVAKLREAEKLQAQGLTIPQACKRLGISDHDDTSGRVTSDTCGGDTMAAGGTPRTRRTDGSDRGLGIADWLGRIGLPQYAESFAKQRIGLDVVPQLTDEDLKELGIPLGDRKRLLTAISAFADTTSGESQATQVSAVAERRQMTVVFCDLIGSTELASRLDPEDLAGTMTSYHDCCKEVIESWGGHVAEFLGDGAVVYFGWPTAHEDDAERAVRAALELVASVGRLPVGSGSGSTLASRAGVATGLVMVGETKSDALAHREGVV